MVIATEDLSEPDPCVTTIAIFAMGNLLPGYEVAMVPNWWRQ